MTRRLFLAALLLVLAPTVSAGQSTQAPNTAAAPAAQPAPPAAAKAKDAKNDHALPLTVDADKMERFGKAGLVVFSGNVVARRDNAVQYADRVEVYLDEKGDRVLQNGLDRRRPDHHQGLPHRHGPARGVLRSRPARRSDRQRAGLARRERRVRRHHHDLHGPGPHHRGRRQAGAGEGHLLPSEGSKQDGQPAPRRSAEVLQELIDGRPRRSGTDEVVQDPQGRRLRLARHPARRGRRSCSGPTARARPRRST